MTVQGIAPGQGLYGKAQRAKQHRQQQHAQANTAFSNRFGEANALASDSSERESHGTDGIVAAHSTSYSASIQSQIALHKSGRVSLGAVIECRAKNLSYAQSDNVKVCAEQGYTFKAQVYADRHQVYLEKKMDSGEVIGYEINPLELDPNTEDPIEQMALESWKMASRAAMGEHPSFHTADLEQALPKGSQKATPTNNALTEGQAQAEEDVASEAGPDYEDLSLEQALQKFYDFVEDRIKNGDPKYPIGATEISVKAWNRLIEKIDAEIDAAKEALRQEIQKTKEEGEQKAHLHAKSIFDSELSEDAVTPEQIGWLLEDIGRDSQDLPEEEIYEAWMNKNRKKQDF